MSSNISKRLDAFKKVDEPKEEVDSAAMVKILDEKPSYNRYHVNPKIFSSRNISAPRPLRGTYVSNAKFTSIQSIPFDEPNKCICDRSDRPLICIRCKGTCYGRVSQKCPLHPNVFFLMDMTACYKCRLPASQAMVEIEESTLSLIKQKKR